jgi:hypothetical protein
MQWVADRIRLVEGIFFAASCIRFHSCILFCRQRILFGRQRILFGRQRFSGKIQVQSDRFMRVYAIARSKLTADIRSIFCLRPEQAHRKLAVCLNKFLFLFYMQAISVLSKNDSLFAYVFSLNHKNPGVPRCTPVFYPAERYSSSQTQII